MDSALTPSKGVKIGISIMIQMPEYSAIKKTGKYVPK